jgi:outer membrane protein assembly factor BamB
MQLADNGIALVSPDGELIEERSLHDMLAARPDVFRFLWQRSGLRHPDPDFLHANFVHWMVRKDLAERDPIYALTNVLVTVRDQNTLAIFDWDRGEVVWAWGQGELLRPHGAGVIGNGNIIVFDNRPGEENSRVVELDPLAREVVWEYGKGFYSETRGAVQRLPNGNTFIGESNDGRAIEVTPEGEVVWEWRTPHRNQEARPAVLCIERYPPAIPEGLLP